MSEAATEKFVPSKPIEKAIFGIQEMIYHRPVQGEAKEIVAARDGYFTRVLNSTEQPYTRTYTIGETWQPLKLGWIAEDGLGVSHLCILNLEGQFTQSVPSAEQRKAVLEKVVEVGIYTDPEVGEDRSADWTVAFGLIPVQESIRFTPSCWESLRIRCRSGEAKITVAAIPE